MGRLRFKRPSPAMAVALLALFVALGGAATAKRKAAIPPNSIGAKHLKANSVGASEIMTNAVRSPEIASNAVKGKEIRPGSVLGSHIQQASILGSHIQDGQLGPDDFGQAPAVSLTRSSTATIPDNTPFNLAWDVERFDTANMHNNGSPPPPVEDVRIPRDGLYQVTATVQWAPAPAGRTGVRVISVIRTPGLQDIVFSALPVDTLNADINPTVQTVTRMVALEEGDTLVLGGIQQTDPNNNSIDLVANHRYPALEVTWAGPRPCNPPTPQCLIQP